MKNGCIQNYIQTVFWDNHIDTILMDYDAPTILGACPIIEYEELSKPYEKGSFHKCIQESIKKCGYIYLFVCE